MDAHLSDAPQPAFTAAELAWFKKPISVGALVSDRQTRDTQGRYESGLERLCICGHRFGLHTAASPHTCHEDCDDCSCRGFKPAKSVSL